MYLFLSGCECDTITSLKNCLAKLPDNRLRCNAVPVKIQLDLFDILLSGRNKQTFMAYVLIIDDSEFALEFTKEMLLEAGHEVAATSDPVEFMRLAESEPQPDITIVDSVMPEVQGPELISRLRKHSDRRLANMPVILASALDDQTSPDEGVLLLPKPFGPEELAQALNLALG